MKKYAPRALAYLSMPIMFLASQAFIDATEFFSSKIFAGLFAGWVCYVGGSLLLLKYRTLEADSSEKFIYKRSSRLLISVVFSVAGLCFAVFMDDSWIRYGLAQLATNILYAYVETFWIDREIKY